VEAMAQGEMVGSEVFTDVLTKIANGETFLAQNCEQKSVKIGHRKEQK
jgi:hypothetical protein